MRDIIAGSIVFVVEGVVWACEKGNIISHNFVEYNVSHDSSHASINFAAKYEKTAIDGLL